MENGELTPEEKQKIEDEVVEKYKAQKALMSKIKRGMAYATIAIGLVIVAICVVAAVDNQAKMSEAPQEEPVTESRIVAMSFCEPRS